MLTVMVKVTDNSEKNNINYMFRQRLRCKRSCLVTIII